MALHELEPAVELIDVYKTDPHSGTQILGGISIQAAQGEFVAITGQSGSGKSTVLRTMSGLELPDSGSVQVLGADLYGMNQRKRSKFVANNIGIGFQAANLDTNLTVYDNLVGLAEATGQWNNQSASRVAHLMGRLGLESKAGQKAATLSGGEKIRVALGRSLVVPKRLLLLDEPTSAVDPSGKEGIFTFLREMRDSDDSTVVIVSHDPQAIEHADRQIVIHSGLVAEESVSQT